jgi:putative tricarboxylic transport membrane protein
MILAGIPYGIICGALPGFSATMAVAIILPVSFYFEPLPALILLACTYAGASYGGSITAILINTPGTPEAAATTLDGYSMAKKGEASRALGASNGASFIGGLISYLVLL